MRRYVSIWFRYLHTDWFSLERKALKQRPFALRTPSHGRMIISSLNAHAHAQGLLKGMAVADARALVPDLEVEDEKEALASKLLAKLAEWCIRFTPIVAIDLPDGLLLDVSGCAHLWGGEDQYVNFIAKKISDRGYDVRVALADSPGVAWAVARFSNKSVIQTGESFKALTALPPEALRLDEATVERLHKLGLNRIGQFIDMPRQALRRRFGQEILSQIDKALGYEAEMLTPVQPPEPYHERLPSIEPILTASGIAIALEDLLIKLCGRLSKEQKGIRKAIFKCYRVDGKLQEVMIETSRSTHHVKHLMKLFEIKLPLIEPDLGIELFVLEAPVVDDHPVKQESMWEGAGGLADTRLAELIDRLAVKVGHQNIHRYLPDEHHWPERSIKEADKLHESALSSWHAVSSRPLQLLSTPEQIQVTAPVPDYPPMTFVYKGKIHRIAKADGPERIEQEWWLYEGQHRDYYIVEDEEGCRYWLFRSGHYQGLSDQWFIHGFFA
jgi:protein ImuB